MAIVTTSVIEITAKLELEKISKNRDIPRPFIIKPPLETKETYAIGRLAVI